MSCTWSFQHGSGLQSIASVARITAENFPFQAQEHCTSRQVRIHRSSWLGQTSLNKRRVRIRCKQCKKYKIQGGYSKKQLSELQKRVARFGKLDSSTGAYIRCRQCVGQQVEELTCCICDEVKGLNGFSKVQRRSPDNAVSED